MFGYETFLIFECNSELMQAHLPFVHLLYGSMANNLLKIQIRLILSFDSGNIPLKEGNDFSAYLSLFFFAAFVHKVMLTI